MSHHFFDRSWSSERFCAEKQSWRRSADGAISRLFNCPESRAGRAAGRSFLFGRWTEQRLGQLVRIPVTRSTQANPATKYLVQTAVGRHLRERFLGQRRTSIAAAPPAS
jgi:hypothetical protein